MHRERISDDIYVFTSGLYAQVTAGVIVTSAGAIVIDTLPFPAETRQVIDYIERRVPQGIRYVIVKAGEWTPETLTAKLAEHGIQISGVDAVEPTLEDVFLLLAHQ